MLPQVNLAMSYVCRTVLDIGYILTHSPSPRTMDAPSSHSASPSGNIAVAVPILLLNNISSISYHSYYKSQIVLNIFRTKI